METLGIEPGLLGEKRERYAAPPIERNLCSVLGTWSLTMEGLSYKVFTFRLD